MVQFDLAAMMKSVHDTVDHATKAIEAARPGFKTGLSLKFRALLLQDFDVKASGGRGVDGTVWKKLAPSTIKAKGSSKIGVEYGEMRSSLHVTTTDPSADVLARYDAAHATCFNDERSLMPETAPDDWIQEFESYLAPEIERVVQKAVA